MTTTIIYTCEGTVRTGEECNWTGTIEEMVPIDDVQERVSVGELMPAGQCPACASLISVDDADVPDYVLHNVAALMSTRGWTVAKPDRTPSARPPRKPRNVA